MLILATYEVRIEELRKVQYLLLISFIAKASVQS